MAYNKIILYIGFLLSIILSQDIDQIFHFDTNDYNICKEQNNVYFDSGLYMTSNPNSCIALSSSFKLKGDKCCRITVNYDILQLIKRKFPYKWRIIASKLFI